ncbi:Bug family tripartite tricarboxylate transporter substrate binding protein [Cupriavidus gilardii]|uniref:Bug family tripartite tricarboxylate transporter substrate binding protein n=1 Tax=Cupriavidus gilardii TaxID=82541 RepID=UPI0021B3B6B5|nr:tripartite tricarboxylate transporter substrate-binding protein [Cupriavidus gilardii]UXC38576.1 tripartite tricarboxylate transporter substrate-binding protein [Cupriavidus gilardii]
MKLAIVAALLLGSVLGTAAMPAAAQTPNPGNWPGKPITLIMPFPAGGPSDALARAVAAKMAPRLGTSIVVENVGGAGGSIGMQKLARAPADGYTIGSASTSARGMPCSRPGEHPPRWWHGSIKRSTTRWPIRR